MNLTVGDVVLYRTHNQYNRQTGNYDAAGVALGRITKLSKNSGIAWIQSPANPPEFPADQTSQSYEVTVTLVPAADILDVA